MVTLAFDVTTGAVLAVTDGPAPVGRDGAERDALRAELTGLGLPVAYAAVTPAGTWVVVGDVLARFGG